MDNRITSLKNSKNNKIVFVFSVLTAVYWWLSHDMNVYSNKLIGAIYEYLWLGALASLIVLPIITIFLLSKENWNIRFLNVFSLIIQAATVFYLYLR